MAGTPPVKQHSTLEQAQPVMLVFLAGLRKYGTVLEGCKISGIDRGTAYLWRKKWVWFDRQWTDALEDAADSLEKSAMERCTPIDSKSDGLLQFMLRGMRKVKYSDRLETVEERVTRATVAFTGVDWFDEDEDEDAEPDTGA